MSFRTIFCYIVLAFFILLTGCNVVYNTKPIPSIADNMLNAPKEVEGVYKLLAFEDDTLRLTKFEPKKIGNVYAVFRFENDSLLGVQLFRAFTEKELLSDTLFAKGELKGDSLFVRRMPEDSTLRPSHHRRFKVRKTGNYYRYAEEKVMVFNKNLTAMYQTGVNDSAQAPKKVPIVVKRRGTRVFLNLQREDKYETLIVELGENQMDVRFNFYQNNDSAKFVINSITPIRSKPRNKSIEINPTDADIDKLLRSGLIYTRALRLVREPDPLLFGEKGLYTPSKLSPLREKILLMTGKYFPTTASALLALGFTAFAALGGWMMWKRMKGK